MPPFQGPEANHQPQVEGVSGHEQQYQSNRSSAQQQRILLKNQNDSKLIYNHTYQIFSLKKRHKLHHQYNTTEHHFVQYGL